jgi:hypothetical protein
MKDIKATPEFLESLMAGLHGDVSEGFEFDALRFEPILKGQEIHCRVVFIKDRKDCFYTERMLTSGDVLTVSVPKATFNLV